MTEKSREQKLRRAAKRVGLIATKGSGAGGDSGWMIIEENSNVVYAGGAPVAYSLSLEEAEEYVISM